MKPKKDKILHVRVSGHLDDLIQRQADELKIPVSQLVRSLLENRMHDLESWFKGGKELAEMVADDVTRVAGAVETALGAPSFLTGRLKQTLKPALRPEDILGWQEITLAKPVTCGGCGQVELASQEKANMALHEGSRKYFFCQAFRDAAENGSTDFHCPRVEKVHESEPETPEHIAETG